MKRLELNATQLKLIAIVAMTIDHLTWLVFPGLVKEPLPLFLHLIGRLTAPIMWYFIAEGCFYTKDIQKYGLRLLGFTVLSHFAFCFGLGVPINVLTGSFFNKTSVLFPLALSVFLIAMFRNEKYRMSIKIASIVLFCGLTFTADWSNIALMLPFFLYHHRGDKKKQVQDYLIWVSVYAAVYVLFIDKVYGLLQFGTLLSLPLLLAYDGTKGRAGLSKWFFYLYFPAHLVVIGFLRLWLHGDVPLVF